jgi:ribonuclease D
VPDVSEAVEAGDAVPQVEEPHAELHPIETREAYLAAVETIRGGHGPVAVDAERASGFRYSQRAYLIQLYRRGAGTFLFDPPAIGDFSELDDAIRDEEWVLHAASQDLPCLREVGLNPARVFDTELGARLAGLPRVGLGAVVEQLLGIHLAKEHSAADWSTRPLPQSWLVYAALDVELLVDLRDALDDVLRGQRKSRIAAEEFAGVLVREAKAPRAEPWRRLSGLSTLHGARNLAVARELWLARDEYAREVDTSPGRLMPDSSIVAAARTLPASRRDLAGLKDFTGRASRAEIGRWWDAVEAGLAADDLPPQRVAGDPVPPPRVWADRNAPADRRLKLGRAALLGVAELLDIPSENVLTPDTFRRLAWSPPEHLDLQSIRSALEDLAARPWQVEATAQVILDAFVEAGQSADVHDGRSS